MYLMRNFLRVLDDCGLVDMSFVGYPYTWEKGRGSKIKSKLEEGLLMVYGGVFFPVVWWNI